ncbi:MAG: NhaP-type Na+/H+ and K+/H+ antiporter [Polaribacter sp.]
METYIVKSTKEKEITISGDGNHAIWNEANSLTNFSSPWDVEPVKKIEFKAIHNSEKIFFQFKVDDNETHIHPVEDKNESINNSDRVELFFKSDNSLNPYYCLEIDTTGRIMDFKAKPNKAFDYSWNWPTQQIEVKSTVHKDYFIVEVAISIRSLKDLNLLKDGFIETGVYRAKYNQQQNNTFEPTWITWIHPKTETPDFHIFTSFGLLKLENK